MKKFAVPLFIGLILSAFALSGCNNQPLVAPEDTWCKVDTQIANQDIDLYFYYTTSSDKTVTFKSDDEVTLDAGLTVVVVGNVELTNGTYAYLKSFPTNKATTVEGSEESDSGSITFSSAMWDAIYLKWNKSGLTTTSADGFEYCTKATSFADLGESFKDLTWKQIAVSALEMSL